MAPPPSRITSPGPNSSYWAGAERLSAALLRSAMSTAAVPCSRPFTTGGFAAIRSAFSSRAKYVGIAYNTPANETGAFASSAATATVPLYRAN